MTDPYASVAAHYDIMVDWQARLTRERPFFAALLAGAPNSRVLDVGCGTGHHSRLFAELGAQVVGIDPSLPMIERARTLAVGDNPRFVEGGFEIVPELGSDFGLIVVLGNTLAYVKDADDLRRTLQNIHAALAPGGSLCVQVVNYDHLYADRFLPLIARQIDGREFIFIREYRQRDGKVEFTLTTLIKDGEWHLHQERSLHYPITSERLREAMLGAGFTSIELYGDYQKMAFDQEFSASLIAVARRA